MLSVIMLNVTYNPFVLSVVMLSVVRLNVIMLRVVASYKMLKEKERVGTILSLKGQDFRLKKLILN